MPYATTSARGSVRLLSLGVAVALLAIGVVIAPLGSEPARADRGTPAVRRASVGRRPPANGRLRQQRGRRHRAHRPHHRIARPTTTTSTTIRTPVAASPTPVVAPIAPPSAAAPARHASIAPATTGSFVFDGYAPLRDRPLRVWYWAPADLADAKVLFVMHGQSRAAESYRDSWVDEARDAHALLVVPEFSDALYPGSDAYNLGNVATESPSRWSYSMLEPLFDYIRADTGTRSESYLLYGHSAGAQFVHRFLLLVPDNRVERAVVANAGWYTAPETEIDFPYGLRGSPVRPAALSHALAMRLTVLLGENDTDPNAPDLRHTAAADRQGLDRFTRGLFFFAAGRSTAAALGAPFGWSLQTVPGVAHSNGGMAPFAARELFS